MKVSPSERAATTRRDVAAELAALRNGARARRSILLLRNTADPDERVTRAAVWKAKALAGFDDEHANATSRNHRRFLGVTAALVRDIIALPAWITSEPPEVREARHAAALLPRYNKAFIEAAAIARASIEAVASARFPQFPDSSPPPRPPALPPRRPPPVQVSRPPPPCEPLPRDIVIKPGLPAHLPSDHARPVPPPTPVPYRQYPPRRPTMMAVQMPWVHLGTPRKATPLERLR